MRTDSHVALILVGKTDFPMACIIKAISDDDRIRDDRLEVGLVPISTCSRSRHFIEARAGILQ